MGTKPNRRYSAALRSVLASMFVHERAGEDLGHPGDLVGRRDPRRRLLELRHVCG